MGVAKEPPRRKFQNITVEVDGQRFDSKREARRYQELLILQRIGEISGLKRQVVFDIEVNGHLICRYVADACYRDERKSELVVEDVKSKPTRTKEYRLKKKLMLAVHGIAIREVF